MAANTFLNLPGNVKMPIVGLGTWQAQDEAQLVAALNAALENGYRHIDTAFLYENEKIIGKVLKEWFDSGKLKRKDIFITTKLPHHGVHPDRVEHFMKKSLENLQLDYVDLYLIHFPVGFKVDPSTDRPLTDEKQQWVLEGKTDHVAIWKKMEEQVDAGRTKTIGLSNYNASQIATVLKSARIKPANLQVELHVFFQQRGLVEFCHKNGITVVAFSPLGSPGSEQVFKRLGREDEKMPDILGDPVIKTMAKKYSKTPAQIVLRYLIERRIGVIPKSVSVNRIKENIALFDFTLAESDIKKLVQIDRGAAGRIFLLKLGEGMENHPDYPLR